MSRAGWLLCLLMLVGCTPQTADTDTYRDSAHVAVSDALSEVASTALVLRQRADGQVWEAYAVTTVRTSEQAVATVADGFLTLQPPPSSDDVASRTSDLLSRSQDLVTAARVALMRSDRTVYAGLVDKLDGLAADLSGAEDDYS